MKFDFKIDCIRDILDSKRFNKKELMVEVTQEGKIRFGTKDAYGGFGLYNNCTLTIEQAKLLRTYLNENLEA